MERIHQLVKRSETAPESVITLLENTLIGTEGSLYQLLDTRDKVHQLVNPNFIYLERNGNAIGNITICDRDIALNGTPFISKYIRYFAFDKIFQGSGKKGKSEGKFQAYFSELFKTNNLDPTNPEAGKSMFWAFIDPQNMRSFNMNERFGFQTIGYFKTTAFSRNRPKKIEAVRRITDSDKQGVREMVEEFYKGFNFISEAHLFDNNDFFILEHNDEIVAGIQANPARFRIESLPGLGGSIMVKAAPFIPGIRKIVNPKEHRFLATEGVFWKEGHSDKLEKLLEGTLFLSQHNSLLIWTDDQNKMLEGLPIKWGALQKIKKNNSINIVAKFNGFDDAEISQIKKGRKYLSGFDMT